MTPFEISVEDLKRLRDENAQIQLIDIREQWESELTSIGGTLIPMRTLPEHLNDLREDIPLILYCHSGGRTAMAAEFLRRNGFPNAQSLAGGIDAWSRRIDPTVKRY